MKFSKSLTAITFLLIFGLQTVAQTGFHKNLDSLNNWILRNYKLKNIAIEQENLTDSLKKAEMERQFDLLGTSEIERKIGLSSQIKLIDYDKKRRKAELENLRDSLRLNAKGYPVTGAMNDTLFWIYSKLGASTARERAGFITEKINKLYNNDFLVPDSILVIKSENTSDIVYGETIVMSVSENDALWYGKTVEDASIMFKNSIRDSILKARNEYSLFKMLFRSGMVLLVLAIAWGIIWLIGKGFRRLTYLIEKRRAEWIKDLSYRDYTFLTAEQEMEGILILLKVLRWFTYAVFLYITLPIIFSIFPFSRTWADTLFHLIWQPFKGVLLSVWNYMPKLFSILVIYFVMKYVIRFTRYIFREIESEKLKISGFHADWAMPTYGIIRFLLYAFTFVIIFPFLPGSESDIFKGVSVFIGVLFSLGSSSAIANMVAGLVITYMRPFKIGDRIKIGEVAGDVIEKTLLVTRIKTIKNEIITIPNSSILTGNTTNYSIEAVESGLIVHTTVTIGYDVPWKDMHQVLIDAALRTELIMKEPQPFVLQTSLDDFYVSYQINAYTREASKQAIIYSNLHQNIQDICFERGIEILSPHYRAARDGSKVAMPEDYIPEDYQTPGFNVNIRNQESTKKA